MMTSSRENKESANENRRGPGVTPENWQLSDLQQRHRWTSQTFTQKQISYLGRDWADEDRIL
jgi:hypothetical protein